MSGREIKEKFKAKAKEFGDKMKNTGSVLGGIKGLFKGYDVISDKPKTGFHGFHSSGQSSGFQGGNVGGFSSQHDPSISAGGAPTSNSKFQGFGSGSSARDFQNHSSSSPAWSGSSSPKHKKSSKKKKKKQASSSEPDTTDSSDESSSEDEETRRAREKEERRRARKARKAAEAEAAAAEAAAKAQRKEARRAKREAKDARRAEREAISPTSDTFVEGQAVVYKNRDQVTIVAVHRDDTEPYYTIKTKSGKEKQTTIVNLCKVPGHQRKPSQGHDFSGGHWTNDIESLQLVLRALRDALGESWVNSTKKRFEKLADDEGMISVERFSATLAQYLWINKTTGTSVGLPEEQIQDFFRGWDRDGNGMIDIREFMLTVALCEESWEPLEASPYSENILAERAAGIFRVYDRDMDGVISLEDLVRMIGWLHMSCGSEQSADAIQAEAREVLQVLPTGTFSHGISLASFVQAVQRKDIFQDLTHLLQQGFSVQENPQKKTQPAAPAKSFTGVFVADDSLEGLVDDFAQKLEYNQSAPGSLEEMDRQLTELSGLAPSSDTPASANSDGSKLDMSAFFSPQDGSSSEASSVGSESDDYEDLLRG